HVLFPSSSFNSPLLILFFSILVTDKSSSFFHLLASPPVPDYSRLKLCLLSANLLIAIAGVLVVLNRIESLMLQGIDWSGLHCNEDCYLAHERLAIIDPISGDQPLYNGDKTIVITVNGEIYNHKALRETESLKSHKYHTESDCEVLAH
ncbi:hypothetical protein HID58_079018, partial [Brassica napus]